MDVNKNHKINIVMKKAPEFVVSVFSIDNFFL
jgi:hypothetical protein